MCRIDSFYSSPSFRTFARSLSLGLSVAALTVAGAAHAQETELPGINVQSAKAKGIGQSLNLWERPSQG